MRLDKFLANQGFGSRKEVKQIIKKGHVQVNGAIIKDEVHINEQLDEIFVDNNKVEYKKYVYLMLNKPKGYISATKDQNEKTVLSLIKDYEHLNLFPIGRLDKDTEGLLLLTNDGMLAHQLLSPTKKVYKGYYAETKKNIRQEDIQRFNQGITIDTGYQCLPAKIECVGNRKCYVSISEGKFHQIKKMFKATNNKVEYLKRVSFADIELDNDLKLGEYRELTKNERQILRK